ncbi:hypothetical protein [Novosphingobium subterraneum]|uniref:hypothetical protein n=1 Tax=Novosphingobium subterraneum TaxID=48936 RepID=UPI0012E023EE|nr:hypothetical protein [Novosphingobium subterraneum]
MSGQLIMKGRPGLQGASAMELLEGSSGGAIPSHRQFFIYEWFISFREVLSDYL